MATPRILIIEDDADIAESLRHFLEREGGFRVVVLADGRQGFEEAVRHPPDLVILDLNLPSMDGFEVCRLLRQTPKTAGVPILMLTARVTERDRIAGLEIGADDYIDKPFSLKEVLARARAALRRSGRELDSAPLATSHITLDETTRRVFASEVEVHLTRKEFDLLAALIRHHGRVLTRETLLERVWGYDHPGSTRTVDVHIRQLRKKLGSLAADPIETVVGVGYRFRSDE